MTIIDVTFNSKLAEHITEFVAFKRLQQFQYDAQIVTLRYFDDFLVRQNFADDVLSREIVDAYIVHTSHLKPNTRYSRLSIVRNFSRYLNLYEPDSYVLYDIHVKRPISPRFYIYSDEEIQTLLKQCSNLKPNCCMVSSTFKTLIGLIAVTGLRINEALSLNLGDLHLRETLLFVRKGKFSKDRWVPLAVSTTQALDCYLLFRKQSGSTLPDAPLFQDRFKRRVSYDVAQYNFRKMIRRCGIGKNASQLPRVHDLRHSYATKCLLKWYQQGEDVNAKLPLLATCMGHVSIASTQRYLHLIPEFMTHIQQRFFSTLTLTKHLPVQGDHS